MPYADPSKARAYRKEYYAKHRHKACAESNAYYQAHKTAVAAKRRERHLANRGEVLLQMANYRRKNQAAIRAAKARWGAIPTNRSRLRRRFRERYANDTRFHLGSVLRCRIRRALKAQATTKARKTTELLGCTVEELRCHIEAQFTRGMSWTNYGRAWHIDHIIPCSAFDLCDPRQQRQCFHYTNLRPLWARANIRKGKRVLDPQLSLLM